MGEPLDDRVPVIPSLKNIAGTEPTCPVSGPLTEFKGQEAINFSGCTNVSDKDMKYITHAKAVDFSARLKNGFRVAPFITGTGLKYLRNIEKLDLTSHIAMEKDYQFKIEADSFRDLKNLTHLNISGRTYGMTDKTFEYLGGLKVLSIANCGKNINGTGFEYLKSLEELDMHDCAHIAPENLKRLPGTLKYLNVDGCPPFVLAEAKELFGVSLGNSVVTKNPKAAAATGPASVAAGPVSAAPAPAQNNNAKKTQQAARDKAAAKKAAEEAKMAKMLAAKAAKIPSASKALHVTPVKPKSPPRAGAGNSPKSRKATRKNRKASRKSRKASRKSQKAQK